MIKFGLLIIAAYVCSTTALPSCVCARNYLPICGSDGVTYSNQCNFDCAQKQKADLTMEKQGECDEGCFCTMDYSPVCGNDGVTYPNKCALLCEKKKGSKLEMKSTGSCPTEDVTAPTLDSCGCTREEKYVCGTDGITYTNPCLLNCYSLELYNSELHVNHAGQCADDFKVKVVESPLPEKVNVGCVCTREYKPVCSVDGVTYGNRCMLQCAGAEIQNAGAC